MEPLPQTDSLTPSQRQAVQARGNVLVMAGAGTGKTKTLVARCLDCLERDRVSLDQLLVVTFTEAAAAEMRLRLRRELENRSASGDDHWADQVARFDAAHIGTLHGFCMKLVREHFHELGLDPQLTVLDEGQARLLADEVLNDRFEMHYEGADEFSADVQNLIQTHGAGRDEQLASLILRVHHYAQSRPNPDGWLAAQLDCFSETDPRHWKQLLLETIAAWREEWIEALNQLKAGNGKAAELLEIISKLRDPHAVAADILEALAGAEQSEWPGKKTVLRPPLQALFDEADFLATLARERNGVDPLAEDWTWCRGAMMTLLRLAREFGAEFSARKAADGVVDFHDLEQFTLKLLWDFTTGKSTEIAETWRRRLEFIFVDEYQDINAAQDKIIEALGRDTSANRFLVGDVKQSIYRFRLADPKIFRDYARDWRGGGGQAIVLAENFRSHGSILDFVNSLFSVVMQENVGGVKYDADAHLKAGRAVETGAGKPELLIRLKKTAPATEGELADLEDAQKEARAIALRLKQLVSTGHRIWDENKKEFRAASWADMAVLLRSPSGKSEAFAKEFDRAGIPLVVERGGFYDSAEILDLLSLLQLLDNPLQDIPCIAVLRSPMVGLTLNELAQVRLAGHGHFWFALNEAVRTAAVADGTRGKIEKFLNSFSEWRRLARQMSLSTCLETVLAETHWLEWLQSQARGHQRAANVRRFLHLAQQFDQFQRQGLFRFLKFVEAQREVDAEPEVPSVVAENAVRLMSIHQSKGLEFPIVVVADLAKAFNEQDLHGDIIFDEELGLCPRVKPPGTGGRYPSLPHWLAQRHQRRELRGEELRLLYVAMTRARDTLILSAAISEKKWNTAPAPETLSPRKIAEARSYADWIGLWIATQQPRVTENATEGEWPLLRWSVIAAESLLAEPHKDAAADEKAGCNLDDAAVERLRTMLSWKYDFAAATQQKAKSSVTALRREAEAMDDEAETLFRPARTTKRKAATFSAADIGLAHHSFLQHVDLSRTGNVAGLEAEAQRLVAAKILSSEEAGMLDFPALEKFWASEIGDAIRGQPENVRREVPFTARFKVAELDELLSRPPVAGMENEFVVVQGVADLVVLLPDGIWLLDFKTDDMTASDLPKKLALYRPQLCLYTRALEKIYSRPAINGWLHFFAIGATEKIL